MGYPARYVQRFLPSPWTRKKVEELTAIEDIEAVATELERLGVSGATPNITEIYEYDFDGNGDKGRIILANMPRTENGYPIVSKEELENGHSGYYYVLLTKDKDGYDTIASWCWPYNFDEDLQKHLRAEPEGYSLYTEAIRGISLSGIFDLNNDGIFELCIREYCYEWGSMLVFALDEHGRWQQVLHGEYGM